MIKTRTTISEDKYNTIFLLEQNYQIKIKTNQ